MRSKEKKNVLNDLKEKTNNCLKSRKNANDIIDIISYFQDDDEGTVLQCIRSVHKLFSHFIDVEELSLKNVDEESGEGKYRVWLRERYKDAVDGLTECLIHSSTDIQEMSLSVLMKLVVKESKCPIEMSDDSPTTFPAKLFKRIMETLLSDTVNNTALLGRFEEYQAYDDVRYYTLRNVFSACRNTHAQETLQGNLYTVLENISLPPKGQDNTLSNFLCSIGDAEKDIRTLQRHRHLYSSAWIHFLKMKLSATLYRKVLVILPDKVMSNMTSPLSLCDFLSQAFNVGGVISLLASNGLFILITKYNLHYPDFYKKLYSLFEPSIFHVKYKARFFHLCDLFLSSTHLPAHLVAAFAKRLARISLSAPPAGLLVAVPFIYNMIIRHPACKKLIHRPDSDMSFDTDPYDLEEEDPEKCGAMNSCLWELKSLQYHYHPDVFKIAKKMDVGIPDMEIDLAEKFDLTANDLFEKEVQKKQKTVAVTFEPPKGLLGGKDDKLNMFWTL